MTDIAHPQKRKSKFLIFFRGARPWSLCIAAAPVLAASAIANEQSGKSIIHHWYLAAGCFFVAICLQIGANFANDYYDGIKGTDNGVPGAYRIVPNNLASARTVKNAAIIFLAIGAVIGLVIAINAAPVLIPFGLFSILAAWFYTGTKHAYGYKGYGEVAVFICFGLIETVGTYYVVTHSVNPEILVLGATLGLLADGVLLVNNVRDIESDRRVEKFTLSTRVGGRISVFMYGICVCFPIAFSMYLSVAFHKWYYLVLLLFIFPSIFLYLLLREALENSSQKRYVYAIKLTSLYELLFSVALLLLSYI